MLLGKVVGTVVATRKDYRLTGLKFHVVRRVNTAGEMEEGTVVAVDSVGVGAGEVVLYATGSSARMTKTTEERPVDALIMAVVDTVEVEGRLVYQKE
jgi:ethanolamine utilization protein EutN/carbon dioxide concentrating mechanism protein CcmL